MAIHQLEDHHPSDRQIAFLNDHAPEKDRRQFFEVVLDTKLDIIGRLGNDDLDTVEELSTGQLIFALLAAGVDVRSGHL